MEQRGNGSTSGCSEPYNGLNGTTVILPRYLSRTPPSDDDWAVLVDTVTPIAAANGFTEVMTTVDQPGNHQVRSADPELGSYTDIGARVAMTMFTSTG